MVPNSKLLQQDEIWSMLNDVLKGKAEEDSAKLHKSRYNCVFFCLIELYIGYLCMCTHAHWVDDGDYHTFRWTLFYLIYKLNLNSLIYHVVSMIESLGKETFDFYELVSCRIQSFHKYF